MLLPLVPPSAEVWFAIGALECRLPFFCKYWNAFELAFVRFIFWDEAKACCVWFIMGLLVTEPPLDWVGEMKPARSCCY